MERVLERWSPEEAVLSHKHDWGEEEVTPGASKALGQWWPFQQTEEPSQWAWDSLAVQWRRLRTQCGLGVWGPVDAGQGTKSHRPQLKDPAWHSRYPRSRVLQLRPGAAQEKEHSSPAVQRLTHEQHKPMSLNLFPGKIAECLTERQFMKHR